MLNVTRSMALALTLAATTGYADEFSLRSAVGGGLGGALGGFLGAELGGRNAAILGSGLAAAAGTAVATDNYPKPDSGRYYGPANCPPGQWKNGRCYR